MMKTVGGIGLLAGLFCGVLAAANPACTLVPGWTQKDEPRNYVADNLFEYMDGNAEGYLLYGFQNMHGVTCNKDGVQLIIDVSDFGDPDSAFGMFSANRDMRQPMTKIGMGGQVVPRKAIFVKGQFYVEVGAEPEGDHTATLKAWCDVLEKLQTGSTEPPTALSWFPAQGQQSLRLVPESVLGIPFLQQDLDRAIGGGKAQGLLEGAGGAFGFLGALPLTVDAGETSGEEQPVGDPVADFEEVPAQVALVQVLGGVAGPGQGLPHHPVQGEDFRRGCAAVVVVDPQRGRRGGQGGKGDEEGRDREAHVHRVSPLETGFLPVHPRRSLTWTTRRCAPSSSESPDKTPVDSSSTGRP